MKTNRRDFIKTTGFGAVGLGVLSSIDLFGKDIIASLPRKSPESQGVMSSPLMSKYSDKVFNVEKNAFGLTQIGFGFFEDAGVLRVNYGNGMEKVGFGWDKWKANPNKRKNPFSANSIVIPSRIASTATWLDGNTLQINFKFVDQVHGDKLTVKFEGNNVTVALLSSISENNKNSPEKRDVIKGIMARNS
ncbi:twin-arginine translocation signal domain-containing protein [Runella sp.]|jgi:hypothetical protein|uniref:twin-arginine translocation signal domain-containing protein n=1 Tax=Runella sp. TaxID=1960881 RepID=UPI00301977A0